MNTVHAMLNYSHFGLQRFKEKVFFHLSHHFVFSSRKIVSMLKMFSRFIIIVFYFR